MEFCLLSPRGKSKIYISDNSLKRRNEINPPSPLLQGGRARFALAIIASKEEMKSIPLAPFSKGEEQEVQCL
jgi:hypothetical protein